MPGLGSVVRKFARQSMVYWQKIGSDEFGKPAYADPVVVACRWEDKTQEILTSDNRKVISRGYILLGQELTIGSKVMQGTLADWQTLPTYPAVPTVNQGAREIIRIDTTPDLKGTPVVYEAYIL